MSRVGWSLAIVALAAAMALSFIFAYSSVGDQQRAAQARAVGVTTKKPLSELTATQASKPIQGDSNKQLLKDMRNHVLKDDRILRVRIFNLSGLLVFSTDTGDTIGVARIETAQFRRGSSGGVASVIIEPAATVPSGLAESSERLYATFAALRLQSQPRAAAVVEVDHRYAAIEAAAYRLWRPIQLVIGVLILIALLMLVASFLAWRPGRRFEVSSLDGARPAPGFAQGGSTRVQKELQKRLETVEESLRTAEQRVAAAEREKRQIAERLASAQEQLELMTVAATSAKPGKGDEALAQRLAGLEAERDRMAAEVERLEQELEQRASAPSGEGGSASSGPDEEFQKRVAELEAALSEANAKAASLESVARQFEEERRVVSAELDQAKEEIAGQKGRKASKSKGGGSTEEAAAQMAKAEELMRHAEELMRQAEEKDRMAQGKAQEADEKLAQALERTGQAEEQARQAVEQARQAEDRVSASDQRAGEAAEQLVQANARMQQLETERVEFERRTVAAEQRVGQLEAVTKQAEERMTQLEAGQRQAEQRAAQADVRLREIEQERAQMSEELESVEGSLAAASPVTAGAADGERAAQLAARVEELEAQRRKDVSELQRLHEALSNTQHELVSATKPRGPADSTLRTLQAVEDMAETEADEAMDDIATRLSRAKRRKPAVDPRETEAPASPVEPAMPEEPPPPEEPAAEAGGLSLRARLAKAAAARHRVSGGEDEAQER